MNRKGIHNNCILSWEGRSSCGPISKRWKRCTVFRFLTNLWSYVLYPRFSRSYLWAIVWPTSAIVSQHEFKQSYFLQSRDSRIRLSLVLYCEGLHYSVKLFWWNVYHFNYCLVGFLASWSDPVLHCSEVWLIAPFKYIPDPRLKHVQCHYRLIQEPLLLTGSSS